MQIAFPEHARKSAPRKRYMTEHQRNILKNIVLYVLKDFSGGTDYIKLYKILYFAHREQLALTGIPLIYDNFKAWRYGPVPSFVGSVVKHIENGDPLTSDMEPFRGTLKVRKNKLVVSLKEPNSDAIRPLSRSLLDKYILKCKYKSAKALSKESHDEAWFEAYYRLGYEADGSSTIRPYLMAAAAKAPDHIVESIKSFYHKSNNFYNISNSRTVLDSYEEALMSIYELSCLNDNWDGEDACHVSRNAANNCRKLIMCCKARIETIDAIYPTPTGNLCIDWRKDGNKTSAEIGGSRMAFYYTSADRSVIYDSPSMKVDSDSFELLYNYIAKL